MIHHDFSEAERLHAFVAVAETGSFTRAGTATPRRSTQFDNCRLSLSARARSYSLNKKFFSEPSRNVRSRPFSLSARLNTFLFKQMGKKTLHKILCFGRSVTPPSQKGIKRRPIRCAEIGKRLSCHFRWIRLSSAQNQRPLRRLKPGSTLLRRECRSDPAGIGSTAVGR
jgi:hypothetical protein